MEVCGLCTCASECAEGLYEPISNHTARADVCVLCVFVYMLGWMPIWDKHRKRRLASIPPHYICPYLSEFYLHQYMYMYVFACVCMH